MNILYINEYKKNLSDNKNMDKFYNPFTRRFIKRGTKSYFKLINSHDYNIYVRKNTIKNRNKVVEEIKKLNKNGGIKLKKYDKPINKNVVENKKISEIEFELRTQAFKYKDKSYCDNFNNLVDRNEFGTIEARKFKGINFDAFVDITENPIKKILINDLVILKGIKFDISVKVKFYKWQQVYNELTKKHEVVIEEWLPWINTKNITITNTYEINMNKYYEYLLEKIERF